MRRHVLTPVGALCLDRSLVAYEFVKAKSREYYGSPAEQYVYTEIVCPADIRIRTVLDVMFQRLSVLDGLKPIKLKSHKIIF
jgi:hypothetical protein